MSNGDTSDQWPRGSLLASFSVEARRDLLSLGTLVEFPADHRLLRQGDTSTHVLILLEGVVKATADSANGSTTLLAVRVAGDAVGELASLDGQPRSTNVTAAGLVRARRVTQTDFTTFLERQPAAAMAVTSSVSRKLRFATRRRIDFGTYPVGIRLARVLAELSLQHGYQTAKGFTVGVALSQPELASLIGASEPSVHRALRHLRDEGILETGYRQLVLRDLELLRAFADVDENDGQSG